VILIVAGSYFGSGAGDFKNKGHTTGRGYDGGCLYSGQIFRLLVFFVAEISPRITFDSGPEKRLLIID